MKTYDTIQLTIRHKLFHHDQCDPIGTMRAKWFRKSGAITLGSPKFNDGVNQLHDGILAQLKPVVRNHVREFLKDTRYCILWNEDTGIETTCRME